MSVCPPVCQSICPLKAEYHSRRITQDNEIWQNYIQFDMSIKVVSVRRRLWVLNTRHLQLEEQILIQIIGMLIHRKVNKKIHNLMVGSKDSCRSNIIFLLVQSTQRGKTHFISNIKRYHIDKLFCFHLTPLLFKLYTIW